MAYFLGIDIGTTYTAAAVWRDGRYDMVGLGNRAQTIPSVVLLRDDETVLTGEAAARRAATEPLRVAREFKRRLGDPTPIIVAGTPYSADALIAKLLRWVVDKVTEGEGGPPDRIAVSHPANWGAYKLDLLRQSFRLADLDDVVTVTEPEAAAIHYASLSRVEPGAVIAVYDLGGGTFDAAVLRKSATGWDLLGAPEGIERLGGVDFDAAVYHHVVGAVGTAIDELDAADPAAMAAVARLRQECVEAKEALSSDSDVSIPVLLPNLQTEVRLTRSEYEQMVRPALGDTMTALNRALRSADVAAADVTAVLLVGGSSRTPLVAEMVTSVLGRPVAVDAHPKHGVALGASITAAAVSLGHGSTDAAAGAGAVAGAASAAGAGGGQGGAPPAASPPVAAGQSPPTDGRRSFGAPAAAGAAAGGPGASTSAAGGAAPGDAAATGPGAPAAHERPGRPEGAGPTAPGPAGGARAAGGRPGGTGAGDAPGGRSGGAGPAGGPGAPAAAGGLGTVGGAPGGSGGPGGPAMRGAPAAPTGSGPEVATAFGSVPGGGDDGGSGEQPAGAGAAGSGPGAGAGEGSSRRPLVLVLAAVVVLALVGVGAAVALGGNGGGDGDGGAAGAAGTSTTPTDATTPTTVGTTTTTVPDGPFVVIDGVAVDQGRYRVDYHVSGFDPLVDGGPDSLHVHFFLDTTLPENAGNNGTPVGDWDLTDQPSFLTKFGPANKGDATQMCSGVATVGHDVFHRESPTGTCADLPA